MALPEEAQRPSQAGSRPPGFWEEQRPGGQELEAGSKAARDEAIPVDLEEDDDEELAEKAKDGAGSDGLNSAALKDLLRAKLKAAKEKLKHDKETETEGAAADEDQAAELAGADGAASTEATTLVETAAARGGDDDFQQAVKRLSWMQDEPQASPAAASLQPADGIAAASSAADDGGGVSLDNAASLLQAAHHETPRAKKIFFILCPGTWDVGGLMELLVKNSISTLVDARPGQTMPAPLVAERSRSIGVAYERMPLGSGIHGSWSIIGKLVAQSRETGASGRSPGALFNSAQQEIASELKAQGIDVQQIAWDGSPAQDNLLGLPGGQPAETAFDCAVLPPRDGIHRATLIYLHGCDMDNERYVSKRSIFAMNGVRVVLPLAPMLPISAHEGEEMRSWYDCLSDPKGFADSDVDRQSLEDTRLRLRDLLISESEMIARLGTGPQRPILVGGFAQGSAAALHAVLLHPEPVVETFISICGYALRSTPVRGPGRMKLHVFAGIQDKQVPWHKASRTFDAFRPHHDVQVVGPVQGVGHDVMPQIEASWLRNACAAALPWVTNLTTGAGSAKSVTQSTVQAVNVAAAAAAAMAQAQAESGAEDVPAWAIEATAALVAAASTTGAPAARPPPLLPPAGLGLGGRSDFKPWRRMPMAPAVAGMPMAQGMPAAAPSPMLSPPGLSFFQPSAVPKMPVQMPGGGSWGAAPRVVPPKVVPPRPKPPMAGLSAASVSAPLGTMKASPPASPSPSPTRYTLPMTKRPPTAWEVGVQGTMLPTPKGPIAPKTVPSTIVPPTYMAGAEEVISMPTRPKATPGYGGGPIKPIRPPSALAAAAAAVDLDVPGLFDEDGGEPPEKRPRHEWDQTF